MPLTATEKRALNDAWKHCIDASDKLDEFSLVDRPTPTRKVLEAKQLIADARRLIDRVVSGRG